MYIYMGTYRVKLATVVESDLKAPFLKGTTLRCRGGCYFFFLYMYLIMLSVRKGNFFESLYRHLQIHNDTMIKRRTQEDFFNKIFTSQFIARVRKALLRVCVWEGAGDRIETAIFWLSLLWPLHCVFLVLLMLNRRSRGPLCWVMASFTASYQQLLWSPNSIGVPEGPLGRVWLSLPHLVPLRLELELALDFCLDWAI